MEGLVDSVSANRKYAVIFLLKMNIFFFYM